MSEPLLQGIRVVEAAMVMMAPSVCSILADMGAEVIKVEPPEGGDTLRHFHKLKGMPESDIPYPFLQLNRNKKSIAIDLKSDEGLEIFHKLLATADVFVSNVRPQALKKLGLDYATIKEKYPRLIYATGLGFGKKGPDADRPGYDATTYWARSGMESTVFPLEGWLGPTPPGSGDLPTGLAMFGGIMTALFNRERTGKGTDVTVSLMATGAWANSALVQAQLVNAEFLERRPRENAYNFIGVYYKTKDERVLKLAIVNIEQIWPRFGPAISRPEITDDPRWATTEIRADHTAALIALIDEEFAKHDWEYWKERLTEYDIPYSQISSYEEVAEDPQYLGNDTFVSYDHPQHGPITSVNHPILMDGAKRDMPIPPPELGQHTEEILSTIDYDKDAIDALVDRGIVSRSEQ